MMLGLSAAIGAAALWAIATLFYNRAGSHFSALQLNLVKGVVACPLLFLLALALPGAVIINVSQASLMLMLSGVIGITLGDSCYFAALRRLGPWQAMLLEYLAPLFAALIAYLWLGEALTTQQLVGAMLIMLGLIWVLAEQRRQRLQQLTAATATATVRWPLSGIAFGVAAALCQALGLVLAFDALNRFPLSAANAALLRLLAGSLALFVIVCCTQPRLLQHTVSQLRRVSPLPLLSAIFFGTFLAIWLQQLALSQLNPGLVQTLLSTAPLFLIPIGYCCGQKSHWRSILAALVALAGIAVLLGVSS